MSVKTYQDHIDDIKDWLIWNGGNVANDMSLRNWCLGDIQGALTPDNFYDYFNNDAPNKQYQTEYNNVNKSHLLTNTPVAHLQIESDNLDGLAKMYIYRHQCRLKNYRDDAENKTVRTPTSLNLSLSKLQHLVDSMSKPS